MKCPSCGRSFAPRAADAHIKFCMEKKKREQIKKKWDKPKETKKEADKGRKDTANGVTGTFESPIRERFNRNSSTKKPVELRSKKASEKIKSPTMETPSSRMSESTSKLSKFCTSCGHKFIFETHRFCGDCG